MWGQKAKQLSHSHTANPRQSVAADLGFSGLNSWFFFDTIVSQTWLELLGKVLKSSDAWVLIGQFWWIVLGYGLSFGELHRQPRLKASAWVYTGSSCECWRLLTLHPHMCTSMWSDCEFFVARDLWPSLLLPYPVILRHSAHAELLTVRPFWFFSPPEESLIGTWSMITSSCSHPRLLT